MCGICGIFTTDEAARHEDFGLAVERMTGLMFRRGPDDGGFWVDPEGHLRLGFRRLAILDLSPAGAQPMVSHDGRSVIVFNGELYNFPELREELEGHGLRFRSTSDTEVVLEALNLWGVEALDRFNGMFAIAWYRPAERELLLARDHAGIKPLYYFLHPQGRGIAFASQYNCLLHTPWGEPGDIRQDVLHLYLRLHHIPPPYGLLENTFQLEPGHYLIARADGTIVKRAWWTLPRDPEPVLTRDEAVEALHAALDNAVRRQRIADVPLGVFLSGGVDSPLVTAIAREQTDSSLKAFTVGVPGWWQDESRAAAAYAAHLDVDHRLHTFTDLDLTAMVAEAIAAQPEPFGDYSIMPTMLISRVARTELTVALSGDGGDELFWGYERPLSLLRSGTDFRWPWIVRVGLYGAGKYGLLAERSSAIVFRTVGDYYFDVNTRMKDSHLKMLAPDLAPLPADFALYRFEGYRGLRHLANYSRWVEFYGQLQRGLKKVDMASMHHSLEVRVPLLDREVIDVSLRMNPFDAMENGTRKAVLRKVLERYVPAESIPRPKRGFAVPLGEWFRHELRPLVEETLFTGDLYPAGLWDRDALRRYWEEHLRGERNHKWGLWTLVVLQQWYRAHFRQRQAVQGGLADPVSITAGGNPRGGGKPAPGPDPM